VPIATAPEKIDATKAGDRARPRALVGLPVPDGPAQVSGKRSSFPWTGFALGEATGNP
jgi:hypothetical protein